MVSSGIVRALGADLRRFLGIALRNRFTSFLVGLAATALLQSSTATALMTTSFTTDGTVALVPALAVMLGANVGTTLIVQVLSFDVSAVAPVLLLAGVVAFKRGGRTRTRDLGRVAIGLGLMLLALHILLDSLAPAEWAPSVHALLSVATDTPIIALVLGAALAWAAHSSVAVVVLAMSLAFSGFIAPAATLALVLGANLGSAINPMIESGRAEDPRSRRLPLGNLLNRVVGCAVLLPFLSELGPLVAHLDPNPVRQAADFHTAFNLILAVAFIPFLDGEARLLAFILPETKEAQDPAAPLHLDAAALSVPSVALTCAAREVLRIGDVIEEMLRRSMSALLGGDRKLVAEIERMDDIVDRLHEAVKLYVMQIAHESLDEENARRAMEIVSFAINLEHIGDIIDKNLMELAGKKIKNRLSFSAEGAAELEALHRRVLDSLKLALGVFMSGDPAIARRLLEEKIRVREEERAAAESHFARLRAGRPESVETSSLHLDVLRDLKRIHSHICAAAYPVLEAAGELQPSRLRPAVARRLGRRRRRAEGEAANPAGEAR